MALYKGEPLQKAMMSFYNAGYKKEEIEEAARQLHSQQEVSHPAHQVQHQVQVQQKPKQQFKALPPKTKESPQASQMPTMPLESSKKQPRFFPKPRNPKDEPPDTAKPISSYMPESKKPTKIMKIILIVIGILILGSIAAYFLFRTEVLDFFNRFFG